MLQSDFVPQFMAAQLHTGTQWFLQDGTPPHTSKFLLHFLNTIFDPHLMSQGYQERHNCGHLWPPLSLDLNSCDLFLWGILREKMFSMKSCNIMEIRAVTTQLCNKTDGDFCRWVMMNMHFRHQEAVRQNRGHIEQVLSRKKIFNFFETKI
jgi:hypothetical protein